MEITVIRAGLLTTVQDRGRTGHRASGVPVCGPVDPFGLRVANLLVGNPPEAAGLEMTLVGPEIEFSADVLVAVGGAKFGSFPTWKPWLVHAGEVLKFGECRRGCRAYLAVAGGLAVDVVLGSRSTYLRAGIGGWQGRALRSGDRLHGGPSKSPRRNAVRPDDGLAYTGLILRLPRCFCPYSATHADGPNRARRPGGRFRRRLVRHWSSR